MPAAIRFLSRIQDADDYASAHTWAGIASFDEDVNLASGKGLIHADGVTAGQFLRANGTRYVPATLDVADLTDLAYAAPGLTLGTSNVEGAASTVIRTDATILAFDATVPTTIQCDAAAAAGSAAVAARRDHTHAIVNAAPGANSVSLAASAEGSATSFARSDHTHSLDVSITPTWSGAHIFNAAVVFNEAGADIDYRIEGSGNANLFFTDAGNDRVAIGHNAPDTLFHLESATATELRLETTGAADPTLSFKTTNTANQVDVSLDESEANDILIIAGQTAAVDTRVNIEAQAGQHVNMRLYCGAEYARYYKNATNNRFFLSNNTVDADLRLQVNDGGAIATALTIHGASANVGINKSNATAQLFVDQDSATGGKPVLALDQADEDYVLVKIIGTAAAASADRTLVADSDFGTPGALIGWFQIEIDDVGNRVADADYWVPFYATPT